MAIKEPTVFIDSDSDDEDSKLVKLPFVYEVCDHCNGHGTSSAYLGAFTQSEWAEESDEFKEDYLAGRYDRPCETCGGQRVVPVVDEQRCDPKLLAIYRRQKADDDECDAIYRMERRMGA